MNTSFLFSAVTYFLGFLGLVAVGLIPFRSWIVMRRVYQGDASQASRRLLVAIFALIAVAAVWCDAQITVRIFRCLTEAYCGPSTASGWTYLAMLGIVYLIFEVAAVVLQKILRVGTRTGPGG